MKYPFFGGFLALVCCVQAVAWEIRRYLILLVVYFPPPSPTSSTSRLTSVMHQLPATLSLHCLPFTSPTDSRFTEVFSLELFGPSFELHFCTHTRTMEWRYQIVALHCSVGQLLKMIAN